MRAGSRFCTAFALAALAATSAAAQNSTAPALAAPPAEKVIGPPQLHDFSLDGTVTRRAETPPAGQQRTQAPESAPRTAAAAATDEPSREAVRQPREEPALAAREPARPAAPEPSAEIDLGASNPFESPPTPAAAVPSSFSPGFSVPPAQPADPEPIGDGNGNGGPSLIPWLLALLALGGAAAWYFLRQRPRLAFAGGASELADPEPRPSPEPLRRAPVPPPVREPKGAGGIVATSLRPWLDIEFTPGRCVFTEEGVAVEFEVSVVNSGSAPARDVLVEACLVNAGPAQDQQVGAFFAHPAGKGERVAAIPPLKRMGFRSAVNLKRDQLRVFQVEGRSLFVPIVGINALYRSGSGEAQTSAAFLVGRDGKGEKMAPFLLDQGPRIFRGLGARELETKVRN